MRTPRPWTYPVLPHQIKAAVELSQLGFREAAKRIGISHSSLYDFANNTATPKQVTYEKVVKFLALFLEQLKTTDSTQPIIQSYVSPLRKISLAIAADPTFNPSLEEIQVLVKLLEEVTEKSLRIDHCSFLHGAILALRFQRSNVT